MAKTVMITGCSSGIGRGLALELHQRATGGVKEAAADEGIRRNVDQALWARPLAGCLIQCSAFEPG